MKKNVYIIQANPLYGETKKTVYIPCAAGCIAAYAWADVKIASRYRLGKFIYSRTDIKSAIASLESPYLVAFSCSVWNMEYNKAFAKMLKEVYPECLVVFGGHHVSPDASNLNDFDFIDILVHGGGEEAFKDILLALDESSSFEDIPNISFRTADQEVKTTHRICPTTVDYPSPYLNGYFDEILKDNINFSAIIETNRGCPNKCAFCDWGDLETKVRLFPMEKVEEELRWMAENKIEYIYCGDANFGLFDRDDTITDLITNLKKEKKYPQKFRVSFTKNRIEFVRKINTKLSDNNLSNSQTLSFQSLSPRVLKSIGRKNLDLDHFKQIMALYNDSGIYSVSELILGLPEETYLSFCEGLCTLLDCGQHRAITVYPCELLPNSKMGNADFRTRYGIQTVKMPYYQIHCEVPETGSDIQEYSDMVVATNTLTKDEWIRSVVFSCYIQALHNLGLIRAIAMYFRHEKKISYLSFYSELIGFFEAATDTLVNKVYNKVRSLAQGVIDASNAWVSTNEKFGHITWGFEETIFLELVSNLPIFFAEIEIYLEKYDVEETLFENLIYYQQSILKQLNVLAVSIELDFDFYNYFQRIYVGNYSPLLKVKNVLQIIDDNAVDSWETYAREIVWYGRREEATLYTGSKYETRIEFASR